MDKKKQIFLYILLKILGKKINFITNLSKFFTINIIKLKLLV